MQRRYKDKLFHYMPIQLFMNKHMNMLCRWENQMRHMIL